MDDNQSAPSAQPSYWAVLPAEIRYDDRIPAAAKLLYAEISSLSGRDGFCWATNDYFAALYRITERSVRRLLDALEEQGYIRIEEKREDHNRLVYRRIFAGLNPLAGASEPLDKNVQRVDPLDKIVRPLDKNVQRHIIKYQEILTISARVAKTLEGLPEDVAEAMLQAAGDDSELLDAWAAFAEMRKANRKPIKTLRTFELLQKKLERYSGGDRLRAIAILEQSTEASWTGLFALKDGPADRDTERQRDGGIPSLGKDVRWMG